MGGVLMVKLMIPGSSRYPWHPRKRPGDWCRVAPLQSCTQLHIELTWSLRGVVGACKAIVCMSWRVLGRMPDSVACRLGRSMATPTAQLLLAHPQIQAHYFSGGRWPSLRIQRCLRGGSCLYVRTLEHFDLQPALAVTTYRLLSSKCGGPLVRGIMNYLSAGSWHRMPLGQILRTTLYVLVVHARMFNEIEVPVEAEAVIQGLPSLDQWAESAVKQWACGTHPMVLRA